MSSVSTKLVLDLSSDNALHALFARDDGDLLEEYSRLTSSITLDLVALRDDNLSIEDQQRIHDKCAKNIERKHEVEKALREKNIEDRSTSAANQSVNQAANQAANFKPKTSQPKIDQSNVCGNRTVLDDIELLIEGQFSQRKWCPDQESIMPKSFLFFGQSGNGKTFIVKCLASKFELTLIEIDSGALKDCYYGNTEKNIIQAFVVAKETGKCILFFDEIDLLIPNREGDKNESVDNGLIEGFIKQMDEIEGSANDVLIFAGTNQPWKLDPAIARRFNKRIYITSPVKVDRIDIITNALKPCLLSEKQKSILADFTEDCTVQELLNMIKEVLSQKFINDLRSNYFIEREDGTFVSTDDQNANGVKKCTFRELGNDTLRGKPLTFDDLKPRFQKPLRSDGESKISDLVNFNNDYGTKI